MATSFPYDFDETESSKPVVTLLHGFLGSRTDWLVISPSMSKEFRCLLLDLPGHGENKLEDNPADFTIDKCALGLIRLLDDLGIEKTSIIGYSMGGRLALYFAVKFTSRCDQLVLESSSPGLMSDQERNERISHDYRLADQLEQSGLDSFLDRWYDQPLFDSLRDQPGLLNELKRNRRANDPAGLAASLRMMGTGVQPSLWDRLSRFEPRALFLTGERDSKFTATGIEMADLCPAARLCIIPDAGHNVHLEQPERYLYEVRSFLLTKK